MHWQPMSLLGHGVKSHENEQVWSAFWHAVPADERVEASEDAPFDERQVPQVDRSDEESPPLQKHAAMLGGAQVRGWVVAACRRADSLGVVLVALLWSPWVKGVSGGSRRCDRLQDSQCRAHRPRQWRRTRCRMQRGSAGERQSVKQGYRS